MGLAPRCRETDAKVYKNLLILRLENIKKFFIEEK